MANATYILSRKPWVTVGAKFEDDVRRLGITTLLLNDNAINSQLIQLTNHWGRMRKAYHTHSFNMSVFHEMAPGITHKLTGIIESFNPLYDFQFYENTAIGAPRQLAHDMSMKELVYEFNYNKGEKVVRNNTKRALKLTFFNT